MYNTDSEHPYNSEEKESVLLVISEEANVEIIAFPL